MTSKYWGLILNQADRLLEQGMADKNDDLVLSAGRIRGLALLGTTEPADNPLPKVRPIAKKARAKRPPSAERLATVKRAFEQVCPACNAGVGQPCKALRSTSTARGGDVLRYLHGERAEGSRGLDNTPPTTPAESTPNHPVWGGALAAQA